MSCVGNLLDLKNEHKFVTHNQSLGIKRNKERPKKKKA